ncbi:Uu.00g134670.m01.CDS01 [Anthostomella pinea]|uniref:Uu.00g134670.m01.CDS01 n=1 Tax=Anthostomella pinea TaxID=933095 RepID=A0AAI8VQ59_9PEZI|nr:Uu.00g134670.m01.CDS01 [Anthostomella pinea]
MNPFFQNQSCDPFTPREKPCELGNYAVYSINVSQPAEVVAGIQFASEHNIRLVIKNTGHDYMGKSTGEGSLSLWTHNLKETEILSNYTSPLYSGPAIRIGAGVIGGELYATTASQGYRAVGGTCASVGIAGGYAAGGGHSILNGLYGMGADNVLEWELVTADGKHIVATPSNQYSDLYWAMSGGGAGVWGVVLSMTYKIHPDGIVGGARLSYNSSSIEADTYWKAIETFYAWMPIFVDGLDGGNTAEYLVSATTFEGVSFTVPGQEASAVDTLMSPYLGELDRLGVPYTYSSTTSPNFIDHFGADLGPLPYGPYPSNTLFSNRLFPRAVVEDPQSNSALVGTIRNLTEYQYGYFFLGCESLHVNATGHPENAVLPVWRDTIAVCTVTGYWNWTIPRAEMLSRKEHLASIINPSLEAVTPNSGSYLNEVDSWYIGDWKKEFYGANYDRLLDIKTKYDPNHLFYAYTGVGSDFWTVGDDGRLCRA